MNNTNQKDKKAQLREMLPEKQRKQIEFIDDIYNKVVLQKKAKPVI